MTGTSDYPPDEELVRRVAEGSRDALRLLVERHGARVHRLAARLLGNPDEARDAARDVFVSVFHHAASCRPDARVTPWLHRVAVNRCLTELESRGTRRELLAGLAGGAGNLPAEHGGPAADPSTDPPDDQLERRERLRSLEAALMALPARQRTAVVLHRFEGLGYADIAAAMGCSVGSVDSLLSRARAALVDALRG